MGIAGEALMRDLKGLPPGFRFQPTDEELICDYLREKSSKSPKHVYLGLITDIDFYMYEPFDLPGISCFEGTGVDNDKQWFFFTHGDSKKYLKGSRLNRATRGGYWKTTGRDREVFSNGVIVGMKKTLVFYQGRAPHAGRTNWIMYEYRLANDSDANAKFCSSGKEPSKKDSFVLCRVSLKNGSEKKTKGQHGGLDQGEKSTPAGSAVATEKELHENVIISTAKEVEIRDRDLPFGPFTTSSEENCLPPDDDLQKFLLECLHDPAEEETGDGLLQVSDGGVQSNLFDELYASSKDIDSLNDEASILRPGYLVDSRINGENNVPTDLFMHGDTSELWDLDGFSSPSVLAGDFLELKDMILPW
ncbi:NAC transcription factor 29 [Cryptomeria japonica]|uniref:NAC transcription factor 29 n=1 Tax=Cryptomeria japonica TaxID=3369 RepID=UPI0027DA84BC|nr:NAC transcription factor 29 [Cryptomeria japonica]